MDHIYFLGSSSLSFQNFGTLPEFVFWDFSTNPFTPVILGIPTIDFCLRDYKMAHMINEQCQVKQIVDACSFYTRLIEKIQEGKLISEGIRQFFVR